MMLSALIATNSRVTPARCLHCFVFGDESNWNQVFLSMFGPYLGKELFDFSNFTK